MACNIDYEDLIFSVQKMCRNDKNNYDIVEYAVFIGNVEENSKIILDKLEKREKGLIITKDEQLLLKSKYANYYVHWIDLVKKKIKIRFIYHKIHIDDNVSEIRKKIFAFMSDEKNKNYILPENQELWLEKNNGNYELIGYYYQNNDTKQKEFSTPNIYQPFQFQKNAYSFHSGDYKKNTSENSMLIYDLLEIGNFKKNIIYLYDAKDEEKFLKSKNVLINEILINKYFKQYWPYVNLSFDIHDIKNNYLVTKDYFIIENNIFEFIDKNKTINHSNQFGSCNLKTIRLTVNKNEDYEDTKNYVDLFPIFDYLRENKINEKMPFLKYAEDIVETPFYIIDKKSLENNKISKDTLIKWLGLNKKIRKINGITLKRFYKEYDNEARYATLYLRKSGEIIIDISFEAENNANFHDIEYAVKDCKKIIEDINKNRIVKKIEEKDKIGIPYFEVKDKQIILKKNTKLVYTNIIIPVKFHKSIDFHKLALFAKKFPFFITEIPKDIIKKEEKTKNSIKLRYKRISGFANMNDIILEIDKLKQKYDKDLGIIIKTLEKKYQKSLQEIKGYLLEWEKKYSSKSSRISPEFKTGILITISENNISLDGITKIYQIPIIYNFFIAFMTLFLQDNEKNIKKIFSSKNIESNVYNEDYEFNKDAKINMNELYNYNNDIYLEEDIENIDEDEEDIINTINKSQIVGLASENEIGKNVKLSCENKIINKSTCKDFCNDHKYFLRRLQLYDNNLFNPKREKKNDFEQYSRKCQESIKRQPVVLPYDPETDERIKRESYTYSLKYSSNPNSFQRWYICPKIWCPYCEIPIYEGDIDPNTIKIRATKGQGGICKVANCPFGNHQVFIREYGHVYPGFLDSSFHPNGLCLPCCFIKSSLNPKYKSFKTFKKCIGDEINNEKIKDGQIYILGKSIPIENDRYGKLPIEIAKILKTNLDTGYLGYKNGYLRKGIKQIKNNSFLSCICDILSCDKINLKIDVMKIKHILIEKLNEPLFLSLFESNLVNIFYNRASKLTPLQNYKNYLLNDKIDIDHTYLWDFLQRENVLFENGINIFIFENNTLLCPKSKNVKYFFNFQRKSILLIKSKEYYEPIYYLQGDGKNAKFTCIFDNENEEIKKIFNTVINGCSIKEDINWIEVLKDNIKKYDLHIDNITIENGQDLQFLLNELLLNIKNNKLNKSYLPKMQYVDDYNKVFGLQLENKLYIPVNPSPLINKLKYKKIFDVNEIEKLGFTENIKYTEELLKKTNIKCKITHKILDIKKNKNIVALVNEYNRYIPIINILDNDKTLKISKLNYYTDVNESIYNKIEKSDKRIEIMNKKKFEDETYMRLKFELSKFLQLAEHKNDLLKIKKLIDDEDKNILKNRMKMINLLIEIYNKFVSFQNPNVDYYNYITPNKRVPCFLRKNKKTNNENIILSCEDDPHCVIDKKECKLFINKTNLLHHNKPYDNYIYYISRIADELLRFPIKSDEILNDNIATIINKDIIDYKNKNIIIIHTLNYNEISNTIDKLFLDNKGVFLDNRKLYENTSTKDISFKKNKYIKTNKILFENYKKDDLSIFWNKYLGNKFKVNISEDNLFSIIITILNLEEWNIDEIVNITYLKNKIIQYIKNISLNKNENYIIDLYKNSSEKIFKNIENLDALIDEIQNDNYGGCYVDLTWISKIFNINFIILDKRLKKNVSGFTIFKTKNYKSNFFILLYRSSLFDSDIYHIIQSKNKLLFKYNELPSKFIDYIMIDNNTE